MKLHTRSILGILAVLAVTNAFAQTVPMKDVKEGGTFTADRIDMGFGPMVPIPKGTWKVVKRHEMSNDTMKRNMVTVTLWNEDKASPLRFFTFATDSERYLKVFSQGQWMCPSVPGTLGQTYAIGASSFSFACSNLRSIKGFTGVMESVSKTNLVADADSLGHTNAFVLPYLADPALQKDLGANPAFWRMEVSRMSERRTWYTAGVRMKRYVLSELDKDEDFKALGAWFQKFGVEAINSVEGTKYNPPAFDVNISDSSANVDAAPEIAKFDDEQQLPTENQKFKADYKAFAQDTAFAGNHAFMMNGKGTAWGASKGGWPWTERWAYISAYMAGRGKQSQMFFYNINDRVVWDAANQGK